VTSRGFWLSRRQLTRDELERRILRLWEHGVELYEVAEGVAVIAPRELRVAVHASPGAPLVERDGVFSTAPLGARDRERLERGVDLVVVDGGVARGFRRAELRRVDPDEFLPVGHLEVQASRALTGFEAPPDQLTAVASSQALYDVRAGRSAEQRDRILELIQASQELRQGARRGRARGLVGALFEQIAALFSRRSTSQGAPAGTGKARAGVESSELATSSPRTSAWERLSAAFARLVGRTRLMRLFTRQQAKYLSELFEVLSRHDDLEVLRRAIPLGGAGTGESSPALTAPTLRTAFDISLAARKRGGAGLLLIDNLYADLRRAYEQVFERLDHAGKHEEAAFFLAEILNEAERAVSYLEKHGRLKLAAELAEARKLPAGLLVRQWFLAGNVKRAVAIAVREGAFDDAILRLQKSGQHDAAGALKLMQAERLASGGSLVAAARLVHALEPGRPLALRWLALAREGGDSSGLALELLLDSERFELAHAALGEVLVEEGPLEVARRSVLAEQFIQVAPPAGRPLARELAREVLADAGRTGEARLSTTARALADYVGDAFRADWPAVVTFESGDPRSAVYRYAATDTGSRPLHDVVPVGSRFAVALGEAGVVLVDRQGRRVAHFDQPAEALVVAPDALRLLTVARRGEAVRVGRIDLASRRSDHWGEIKTRVFARHFDGQTWLVEQSHGDGRDAELLVLDVLDERPSALRRVPLPVSSVDAIHLAGRACNVLGGVPFGPLERLRYELPAFTLRERSEVMLSKSTETQGVFLGRIALQGDDLPVVLERWFDPENGGFSAPPRLWRGPSEVELPPDLPIDSSSATFDVLGSRFGVALVHERGARVLFGNLARARVDVDLELGGATSVALRLEPELSVVADSTGRLMTFDLNANRLAHDIRI
jgi:hypothetical protein